MSIYCRVAVIFSLHCRVTIYIRISFALHCRVTLSCYIVALHCRATLSCYIVALHCRVTLSRYIVAIQSRINAGKVTDVPFIFICPASINVMAISRLLIRLWSVVI